MNDKTTVFVVEHVGQVVVVEPLGDESSFRYFDIHNQANRVMRALDDPSVRGVVVDLRSVPTLGWVMTSAIVRLVRNLDYRGGMAVYCSASKSNVEQFSSMKLGEPWSHHDSRDDGVAVIRELIDNRSASSEEGP
ncbi:MAG TPA: hypothetical protein DCE47_04690 [Planctomycetaceae bacterium]|nr:hypothetical protein [Planctomycetaceae bacterium]